MFETVAWISIIVGFVVVISVSLAAMLLTRRREQNAPTPVSHEEAVAKVDAAADAALTEINKTSALILADIEEKYQTLLFLYDLLEEKKKGIDEPVAAQPIAEAQPAQHLPAAKPRPVASVAAVAAASVPEVAPVPDEKPKRRPMPLSAKHEKIISLFESGLQPAEIAKELDMGQGEVKLILDLSKI